MFDIEHNLDNHKLYMITNAIICIWFLGLLRINISTTTVPEEAEGS